MAMKKKGKKKRAAGAGRPANNEPRIQVFSMFGGCNFRMSPLDFAYIFPNESENDRPGQTDQIMNQFVLQNNAYMTPNATVETRQNIKKLFKAPYGVKFTGPACLIGQELYAATSAGAWPLTQDVYYGNVHAGVYEDIDVPAFTNKVVLNDVDTETVRDNTWTYLGYADDKLVGMTKGLQLWTDPVTMHRLSNAKLVTKPATFTISNLAAKGTLKISATSTTECVHRISLCHTYLNKYGPTEASSTFSFYANKPTTEWSSAAYLTISGTAPTGSAIQAVELYYVEGDAQDPAFLAHVSMASVSDGGAWRFNWTGYLIDTSMWAIANLTVPKQNYTMGVPASKMNVHDGQIYFWGNTIDPQRVWIGGNAGNRFSISTGVGGGFVDCDPGRGVIVRSVPRFKTQQGASIITMLCDSPNSQNEHRYNLVENQISISTEQSIKSWQAEKVAGAVGCKSYNGAVVAGDGLYTLSRYGIAITTLTMEYNSQIRVEYVSDAIEPVFLENYGTQLSEAVLFAVNDTLYMTFGKPNGNLDNVIFCYDIGLKTWWTYSLDVDEAILNMIHVDYEGNREGIGIVTPSYIYLLPTTLNDVHTALPRHEVLIETAELTTMQPLQNMHYLSQLEFRFDYFIGDLSIDVIMVDQFGRTIHSQKEIHHSDIMYQLSEYIRIDQVVESYKIVIRGKANMRLTHFISKNYPKSNRIGSVYGFDSRQSHSGKGSIHKYFNSYNDLRESIIP